MVAWWPDDQRHQAHWTLDGLTGAAHRLGIRVERSQVRPVLLGERVRWRPSRSWPAAPTRLRRKEPGSSRSPPTRPRARRSSAPTSSARWPAHLPARTGLVARWAPGQGTLGVRPWRGAGVVYGALRSVTARSAPSPPLAQHRRLEAAAAGDRAGQPDRGAPGGQRQPVQPPQPGAAGVAGRPPRIRQGFIPKRACWWRLFRRAALAGRSLPTPVSSSTPRGWPPASSTGALGRGVGPSAPTGPQTPPQVRVPPLRNAALVVSVSFANCSLQDKRTETRTEVAATRGSSPGKDTIG